MRLENDQIAENNSAATESAASEQSRSTERPERAERVDDRHHHRLRGRGRGRDVRSTIVESVKAEKVKTAEEPRAPSPKPNEDAQNSQNQSQDRGKTASPAAKEIPPKEKSGETVAVDPSQAGSKVAAPAALSKEIKAIWETLPPAVQSEFARRESDTQKGIDQLKAKYKPVEDAFTPFQSQLRQLGKTEADAAKQLLGWQTALANPQSQLQAFGALARAHNVGIPQLIEHLQTLTAPQGAQGQQANSQTDPTQAFRPLLDPLDQRLRGIETEFQRRDRERVQSDISQMSKDKPHFEKVRQAMGILINSGQVPGGDPKEVFDEAYARACRMDPDVFAAIQQEEQERKAAEAEAKAAQEAEARKASDEEARKKRIEDVAKAKRAGGITPRSGAPTGMAISAANKGKSVAQTIREAVTSARGSV